MPSSKKGRRIFFSIGEDSGDLLGSKVAKSLMRRLDNEDMLSCTGGRRMQELGGVKCLADATQLVSIGALPSKDYLRWRKVFDHLWQCFCDCKPDVFVGITHHGFNIPMARKLKDKFQDDIATIMIAPPEIWGWEFRQWVRRRTTAKIVKRAAFPLLGRWIPQLEMIDEYVDRGARTVDAFDVMMCLFGVNFEAYEDLLRKYKPNTPCDNRKMGHPLYQRYRACLDQEDYLKSRHQGNALREELLDGNGDVLLSVFPGSRPGSIRKVLPRFLQALSILRNNLAKEGAFIRYAISVANPSCEEVIKGLLGAGYEWITPVSMDIDELLPASDFALMSSGTITLQAACHGVPGVVGYSLAQSRSKAAFLKAFAKRGVFKNGDEVPFSLPSALLHDNASREWKVYEEFVTKDFDAGQIADALERIRRQIETHQDEMEDVRRRLIPKLSPDGEESNSNDPIEFAVDRICDALETVTDIPCVASDK